MTISRDDREALETVLSNSEQNFCDEVMHKIYDIALDHKVDLRGDDREVKLLAALIRFVIESKK